MNKRTLINIEWLYIKKIENHIRTRILFIKKLGGNIYCGHNNVFELEYRDALLIALVCKKCNEIKENLIVNVRIFW